MSVIITLPQYEETTNYLFAHSHEIIDFANKKGYDVIELKRPRLRRNTFESVIRKKRPTFIFFNGHGDGRTIYGDKVENKAEFLVKLDYNHDILNGKLIYARSCWAAKELGKVYADSDGCFIGYDRPFVFWVDDNHAANPLTDKIAQQFLGPTNELVKSILKGNSASASAKKFKDHSVKNMLKILKNKREPGAIDSLRALWANINSLKVIGNESMSISA